MHDCFDPILKKQFNNETRERCEKMKPHRWCAKDVSRHLMIFTDSVLVGYRIGRFRVFYSIDQTEQIVSILSVDNRRDAYK